MLISVCIIKHILNKKGLLSIIQKKFTEKSEKFVIP